MTGFDFKAARAARAANPRLTEFDTGEVYEPHLDPRAEHRGWVDFDSDESATMLRVKATPSDNAPDTIRVEIDSFAGGRIEVVRDNDIVWVGDAFGPSEIAEEIRIAVATAEWDQSGSSYVDLEGITKIMNAWASNDVRRTWRQEGDGYDAILLMTWWDGENNQQHVDVQHFDPDAENAVGRGWSLTGLPFAVDTTAPAPAAVPSVPVVISDLDGTVDEADWIQPGHVLDDDEVRFLRSLVLPSALERAANG